VLGFGEDVGDGFGKLQKVMGLKRESHPSLGRTKGLGINWFDSFRDTFDIQG